jgi:PAS domain S-box-containing protein
VQEGERRFRTLLESAPDAMVIVDDKGTIRLVNSQAQLLFGYDRAEIVGEPVEMVIPAGLHAINLRHRQEYARKPRPRPMGAGLDLAARHKDGSEIPVEISVSPLTGEGETLFIAAVRDVSQRRQAENQLRRSETQLAEAQALANLGSWEWDLEPDVFSWSRQMYRVLGLDPLQSSPSYSEFLARVHPEDRSRVSEVIRAARERGIPFALHHRLIMDSGAIRTVQAQGTVETDDQGRVLRLVGTTQDVTMQKEIEEELRRSEALYRVMADNLPNVTVLVVDTEMRYRLARGPGLGIGDIASWEGKPVWEVAPAGVWRDRAVTRCRKALAGEMTSEELRPDDGHVYQVQTVPLINSAGDIYAALTLVQNVTEQREAEDTTERLLELSRKLNATLNIDELVNTLSAAAVQLTRAGSGTVYLTRGGLPGTGATEADSATLPAFESDPGSHRSVLRAPIMNLNDQTIGYLEVWRDGNEGKFPASAREKLEGLAEIAAIALQNALSFRRLRYLGQKLVSAQEEERRSLSRELHDSTGQLLIALKMSLSMLHEQVADRDDALPAQMDEIEEMLDDVYEEIRAVSHALRPPSLDMTSIDEALHGLCQDYARHSGLQIDYSGYLAPPLPDNVSISLYRLLQEALTNVAKHAAASKVEVTLKNGNGEIELAVRDDGIGFDVNDSRQPRSGHGVGLLGLRERFELLGGRLKVESNPGSGTRVAGAFRVEKGYQVT